MKKYLIEWETCFCDDFPDRVGECIVEAENKEEAAKKFNVYHAVITRIREVE